MTNVSRLPVKPRITRCEGCGIPLTPEWVSQDDPELCGECSRWRAQMEAVEAFVRGTDPDGPEAA
jgi:recombinational DNA repair protein (RecF pathway)